MKPEISKKENAGDKFKIGGTDLPALYQAANKASINAKKEYFRGLFGYLSLLICAAAVSFLWPQNSVGAIVSLILFFVTLIILGWIRVRRPDDLWYNWRAVAESVKTRAWRWMIRAEPYENAKSLDKSSKDFIADLRTILEQNNSISDTLRAGDISFSAIPGKMKMIRELSMQKRLEIYKRERIEDQADWYKRESILNRKKADHWFWGSVSLHLLAAIMLSIRIMEPSLSLPIGIIATAAGAALTWPQAKKHNELNSSYSLAAHEIAFIKEEASSVKSEEELSDFVMNSEAAFSREHTQWFARKNV